ncbi:hypothetical protein MKX01_025982 [Papaver californicum]|nr:hypothetical protein MKX01_025982 [Papaver californicum]
MQKNILSFSDLFNKAQVLNPKASLFAFLLGLKAQLQFHTGLEGLSLSLLHENSPSTKSTHTWTWFETHLPARHFNESPYWDKFEVVYGVVDVDGNHWVALSFEVVQKKIKIYDSLPPRRNVHNAKVYKEVDALCKYLRNAYNRVILVGCLHSSLSSIWLETFLSTK